MDEEIVVLDHRVDPATLRRLVEAVFFDMVKVVVDVRLGIAALGGDLHADAERILLDQGSRQVDLWGANYYPGRGRENCIEYSALINIRPAHGNSGMNIQDEGIRARVRELMFRLVGEGDSL